MVFMSLGLFKKPIENISRKASKNIIPGSMLDLKYASYTIAGVTGSDIYLWNADSQHCFI